jgi:hypothetical protein
MVTMAMFNALNIGFSVGIHLKYSAEGSLSPVFQFFSSLIMLVVVGSVIAIMICLKATKEDSFGEFKAKFKRSW